MTHCVNTEKFTWILICLSWYCSPARKVGEPDIRHLESWDTHSNQGRHPHPTQMCYGMPRWWKNVNQTGLPACLQTREKVHSICKKPNICEDFLFSKPHLWRYRFMISNLIVPALLIDTKHCQQMCSDHCWMFKTTYQFDRRVQRMIFLSGCFGEDQQMSILKWGAEWNFSSS